MKPIACPSGHVVGMVVRAGPQQSLRRAAVFAHALERLPSPGNDLPVIVAEIDAGVLVCSVCRARVTWHFGEDALNELLARRRVRFVFEE